MTHYKVHTLQIHPLSFGVGAAVNLPDVLSQAMAHNPNMLAEITAGNSSPTHVAMVAERFLHDLQTFALKTALDNTGVKGLEVDSDGTHPGLKVFLQKINPTGLPVAGGVHRSFQISLGLLFPTELTCENQADARLSLQTAIIQKSTNDPLIISDAATLPSITVTPARWTLGPITVGSKGLSNYQRVRIDFGNTVTSEAVQSFVYDSHITEESHAPRIEINGIDPSWFLSTNLPIGGLATTHANTTVYLRKRTQDGAHFVVNGTAEHIKFTMAGLSAIDNSIGAGQVMRPTETSLVIVGAVDASANDPLLVNTASAIT